MELQAIVMAGGRGSHMTDLTNSKPKPLLPVGNKPMIYYPVSTLEKAGFQEIIVVTLNSIRLEVELALKEFSVSIKTIGINDDSDFDTVDSLHFIKDEIKTDMLIISCDIISDLPIYRLVDVYRMHDTTVTMLLCPNESDTTGVKSKKKVQQSQREFIGLCPVKQKSHRVLFLLNEADLEGENLTFKPRLLREFPRMQVRTNLRDVHMYIVKRWMLDYIKHNKSRSSFRSELLPHVVNKQFSKDRNVDLQTSDSSGDNSTKGNSLDVKNIYTFVKRCKNLDLISDLTLSKTEKRNDPITCHAYIYQEGVLINANTLPSYIEANKLVSKSESVFLNDRERIHPTSKIHERSQAGTDSMVGDRTNIGEQSFIKRSVIGKECQIGNNVRISNCILMDRVKVGNGCNVQGSVVGEKAILEENCEITDCLIGCNKTVASSSKLQRESIVDSNLMMEFE